VEEDRDELIGARVGTGTGVRDVRDSGMGHMCIEIDHPGCMIISHTWGRMISPFAAIRS
jgi:hypothetical protein